MSQNQDLLDQLSFLGLPLARELAEVALVKDIPKGTEILREEQYIQVLPLVLSGLVKVYSRFEERELLLYYIQPQQSCVMSFTAGLKHQPSRVFAVTEEDSRILLLPIERVPAWIKEYSTLGNLFYEQYDLRYAELLETIQQILLNKMDKRLYDFLLERSKMLGKDEFKMSHGQIANELGTVREVISRVIKKLEKEGKVSQENHLIKILR